MYVCVLWYQQLEFTCNPPPVGLSLLLDNKNPHHTYRHSTWNCHTYPCINFCQKYTNTKSLVLPTHLTVTPLKRMIASCRVQEIVRQMIVLPLLGKKGYIPLTFPSCHCHLQATLQHALTIFLFPLETRLLGAGNRTHQTSSSCRQ